MWRSLARRQREPAPRRWLARGIAVLLTLAAPALAGASPIRVVLVGDSITEGLVSGEPAPPYAELVANDLGPAFEVVNSGCGGTSSVDWTPTRKSRLCARMVVPDGLFPTLVAGNLPAAFVSILLGTNDAIGFFEPEPVPVSAYGLAIREIVGEALALGAASVLLMTPPRTANASANERLLGYRGEIFSICAEVAGALCGPDLFTALERSRDFEGDDLHPNGAGHRRIADGLIAAILSAPEPGTGAMLGLGLCVLGLANRRGPDVSPTRQRR